MVEEKDLRSPAEETERREEEEAALEDLRDDVREKAYGSEPSPEDAERIGRHDV